VRRGEGARDTPVSATLAVDAGQTEVRAALVSGPEVRRAAGPGVVRMDTDGVGPETVAAALLEAVGGLGELPALDAVGVGLSGFEIASSSDLEAIASRLSRAAGGVEVAIATDGATSLLGALGGKPGAVVAAGTGTVAMAHDTRRWARVDGTGPLLGDAGSGFAIGRAGLDSALRHLDGRGGSEALARAAQERFGPPAEIPGAVARTDPPVRAIAGFAQEVARLATEEDEPAAVAILAGAGAELARSGCAALGRLYASAEQATLSTTGNVFAAGPALTGAFAATVAELRPGTRVVAAGGSSLDGAALLAREAGRLPPDPTVLWRSG
jgi:N-acetylglucosamine kinase-like BadF-type ATPase